jgi:hypothetical protein
MAIERLELPDGQWADIEHRPTHGTIRKIGKETDRLGRSDPLAGEDVIVGNLVREWYVKDGDGSEVALDKRDTWDRIPQDTFSLISDECLTVVESSYPNRQAAR